jgi:formamidopyrimidine-DNA glycosylase
MRSRGRKAPVKPAADGPGRWSSASATSTPAEALFAAGIHPRRAAGSVSRARYARLADEVKRILAYAIRRGGTTLRDFISPRRHCRATSSRSCSPTDARANRASVCGTPIRAVALGQRSTFFCPRCQR